MFLTIQNLDKEDDNGILSVLSESRVYSRIVNTRIIHIKTPKSNEQTSFGLVY